MKGVLDLDVSGECTCMAFMRYECGFRLSGAIERVPVYIDRWLGFPRYGFLLHGLFRLRKSAYRWVPVFLFYIPWSIYREKTRVLRCCSSRHVYQPSHISYAYQSEHLMCEVRSMDKLSVASSPCMRCHSSISHGRLGDPCGVGCSIPIAYFSAKLRYW
jgi:hypothetical protein